MLHPQTNQELTPGEKVDQIIYCIIAFGMVTVPVLLALVIAFAIFTGLFSF